ncbi:AGAP007521-PB [Anopheles gambiae str. PEST]|uniref:Ubiquitin carboxyl-terminal hydrolase 36 n=1 Tax=Anopheles gambiae TaxID=7165 RepID=A0NBG4_ANOGA|nr:AGAP007521-PB [Anopheles gambiae str. PEST]
MPIQMVCDSTPSLVSAAIRDALHSSGGTTNGRTGGGLSNGDDGANDLVESISQSLRQGQQVKPITYEEGPSYNTSLDKLKSKYIVLKATTPNDSSSGGGSLGNSSSSSGSSFGAGLSSKASTGGAPNTHLTMNGGGSLKMDTNTLPTPKRTLFPRENVQIGWKTTGRKWLVGAGMMNMGNTCYLNSTLQALFHVPAIANWLLSDEPHRAKCDDGGSGGSCIICAMAKTLLESQSNQTAFRPYLVYSKLRLVCKHLVPGRQEDAHEFLRYLVEAMEKSYIGRTKNSKELDQYSKETTPLNQILGGYLRSEVKCLSCQHVSTTFQHFEDLLLDIRKANSIDEALELYFARERLEEMGYKCEACKRRVAATKQFSLERAPFVLCVQLKRFSMLGAKINKHVELRSKLDLTPYSSPAMRSNGGKLTYRLTSMVTHLGSTQHCGHYTAIGHTDAGGYHVFDDSSVRPIGIHNVMSTNAYILFYELESVAAGAVGLPNGTCRPKATVSVGQPSSTATLTSMGHLSNGSTPTGFGSGSAGGGSTSGGGGGSGGTPGKVTNSSPLRVLGTGGGNGAAEHAHFSSPSSTASTLSNASPLCSPLKHHQQQQETMSGGSSKIPKLPDINARSATPLNGVQHGEAKGKSLSTPLLASMPKLPLSSPSKSLDNGNGSTGSAVISLVPYDSDDTSSTSEDDDEDEKAHSRATIAGKSLVLTNGGASAAVKRAKPHSSAPSLFANGKRSAKEEQDEDDGDDDDEEEEDQDDEERTSTSSSRSPQMIKTKAGLWKVSKSSTADQLSYPDSGSASSSKSSSPTTSGVSSPTSSPGQKQQKVVPQRNGAASANGAGSRSSSPGGEGNGSSNGNGNRNGGASAVQMLMKYSHRGYGAPVKSWNGQQTAMDRELANDRREERKRQIEDDRETEMDRGRTKKTKAGTGGPNNNNNNNNSGNNGNNPFQQYQNHQTGGGGSNGKWMGNGGNRNHFNNHHQNNYRGGGGGGGYYQNGNGHRHHGGGGNSGFRTGGRRFGGRNGGGFHSKAHHHHQRSESGSGMAGGGGGSNGFYHR